MLNISPPVSWPNNIHIASFSGIFFPVVQGMLQDNLKKKFP